MGSTTKGRERLIVAGQGDRQSISTGQRRAGDDFTIASHEPLTLRVEFLHGAAHGDSLWTIAAYESPVGERLWHATATPTTPVEIMRVLLDSLSTEDSWGLGAATPIEEKDLAHASRPLEDAGWPLKCGARLIDWTAPTNDGAGLRFDTHVKQGNLLPAWTIWGGNTVDSPTWAIHLSTHAPTSLIQDVAFELAHGSSRRPLPLRTSAARSAKKPGVVPPAPAGHRPAFRR
ncbi:MULTISPECIES: DUF317 domain-containing protein [unclassified Streptomyces]|uniref:DUF317 domain-containing protein n=1 Tax=unclassified Streptomyces TaxID=2593676 RepID=UPI000DC76BA7|nr:MULTISPECIES: DUF317 domain-containing protein [unclassified Streptomyces]AWZ07183.1 hypothetical protein DRB89_24065 [Streptomyces sp. ICC4]AWZ17329.1 hypothetical protein DRB96_40260 [Streptomyces sp. ICC1]